MLEDGTGVTKGQDGAEPGTPVTFNIALAGDLPAATTVNFKLEGTGSNPATINTDTGSSVTVTYKDATGADKTATATVQSDGTFSVSLPAGTKATGIVVSVPVTDDTTPEAVEGIKLSASTSGNTGTAPSASASITDNDYQPPIIATLAAAVVSEEGLPGGIKDTAGPSDTTDSAVATSSTVAITYATSIQLTAPTGTLKSGGTDIVWAGSGTSTLTGTVGASGPEAIKITMAADGTYTVNLSKPLDHPAPPVGTPSVENTLSFNVGVKANGQGGTSTTSTLTVTVEDDSPTSGASLSRATADPAQDTNVLITLDLSSSTGSPTTPGQIMYEQLTAAKDLVRFYDTLGATKVLITVFSGQSDAKVLGKLSYYDTQYSNTNYGSAQWLTVNDAIKAIDKAYAAIPNGMTYYEAGLIATTAALNNATLDAQRISGAKMNSFFLTDGNPDLANFSTAVNNWKTVVDAKDINSWGVQFGGFSSTVNPQPNSQLNQISMDGTKTPVDESRNGIAVSDLSALSQKLKNLAIPIMTGNLMTSGTDTVTNLPVAVASGADGLGSVFSVKVNNVTYGYNSTTDKANVGGVDVAATGVVTSGTAKFDNGTNEWTLKFASGNTVTVNMTTGAYSYEITGTPAASGDSFEYTLQDFDGDKGTNTMKLLSSSGVSLTGDGAPNTLTGGTYADVIKGMDGNDSISGLGGNDVLYGGNGNDTINGGAGNDIIYAGAGSDQLTGGAGNDWFVWVPGDVGGTDTITDFRANGDNDRIDLSALMTEDGGTSPTANNLNKLLGWDSATKTLSISTTEINSGVTSANAELRIVLTSNSVVDQITSVNDMIAKGFLIL